MASQSGTVPDDDQSIRLGFTRLAAARLGPVARSQLANAVCQALAKIVSSDQLLVSKIDEDIDALVAIGDLIESTIKRGSPRKVHLAPALFVRRPSGVVFVIGSTPATGPFGSLTRSLGSLRELVPPPTDEALTEAGYAPIPMAAWLEAPVPRSPSDLVAELNRRLDEAGPSGEVPDIEIVDPSPSERFYRGRWRTPSKAVSGRFVARRQRKWGGTAWGYSEIVQGEARRFLTFPVLDERFRACDEAWQVICALDALSQRPQALSVRPSGDSLRLSFATPIPSWAERRLHAIGAEVITAERGYLVSIDVPATEASTEISFLRTALYMTVHDERRAGGPE